MDRNSCNSSQDFEVRKGPWTMEEDLILINYIGNHGEGVWNSLAKAAGLKRTGKSCRLRWLNYLRPDVRRGNITSEEQLLIMELHAKWGNRWSKIAKHLPGRTDNEIKNYWRTRIQKHIKQAENFSSQYCETNDNNNQENIEGASTSYNLTEGMDVDNYHHHGQHHFHHTLEDYSPSTLVQTSDGYQMNRHQEDMTCPSMSAPNMHGVSNDNIWGMEDIWSLQLLNGD